MPDFDFTPRADGYVPSNAYWLAWCADLAYEAQPGTIQARMKELGLTSFRFLGEESLDVDKVMRQLSGGEPLAVLEGAGTQGFVAGNDEIVIVCFRGTEEVTDFVADARAFQVEASVLRMQDGWGRLHKGFATALGKPVRDGLTQAVEELADTGQGIWVTGHSLGGALATLAAAELALAGREIQGVYTFGQPRVGDKDFAKAYDAKLGDRHFRFVNNNDGVTEIPLRVLKLQREVLSYRHVGQRIYIRRTGELSDDIQGFELTMDRAIGYVEAAAAGDFTDGASDHQMVNYLAALEQNYTHDPTA